MTAPTDSTIAPDIEPSPIEAITTTETSGRMMKLTGKPVSLSAIGEAFLQFPPKRNKNYFPNQWTEASLLKPLVGYMCNFPLLLSRVHSSQRTSPMSFANINQKLIFNSIANASSQSTILFYFSFLARLGNKSVDMETHTRLTFKLPIRENSNYLSWSLLINKFGEYSALACGWTKKSDWTANKKC